MTAGPAASIIISAYNRPKVVSFAIRSVLASDFADWEMIVVGDGCNAETEAAIRAFDDPRLRFENLPANTGHQSSPHNRGVELARGAFVMFLNQDDLYFADHIGRRMAFMRDTGAEISWSPVIAFRHAGLDTGPADVDRDKLTLDGATGDGAFDPESFVISSCWAVRHDICGAVGPWMQPEETRLSPSQEWLHRAHRQGRKMVYHPYVSVLCIHSGARRHSYISPESPEHDRAWGWLEDGMAERLNMMHCIAVQQANERVRMQKQLARRERPLQSLAERALARIGVHPTTTQALFSGVGKGEMVGKHRQFTSRPPPLPIGQQVAVGKAAADGHVGRGWHMNDGKSRWTSAATSEILFSRPDDEPDDIPSSLEICGFPLRDEEAVTFRINSEQPVTTTMSRTERMATIDLPAADICRLTISIEAPTSPVKLGRSMDQRILGFCMVWIRRVPRDDDPLADHEQSAEQRAGKKAKGN